MPQVYIPMSLRSTVGGLRQLSVEAATVREAIEAIDRQHPGFLKRVVADDRLRPGIAVAIGSRISDLGLLDTLRCDEELHFVLSVGGG